MPFSRPASAPPLPTATTSSTATTTQRHPGLGVVLGLGAAAALFVVYPALRPYSSETGAPGAHAFASGAWTAAHLAGMAGFVLLAQLVGRLGLGRPASVATGLGATLVLPYYGAEVFGVGAVGRWALHGGSTSQVAALVDDVRFSGPALAVFATGLLLLAVGGLGLGVGLWRRGARTAAVLLGAGLTTYLPQFYLSPGLRITHGVVLGLGLVLAARHARRGSAGTMPG